MANIIRMISSLAVVSVIPRVGIAQQATDLKIPSTPAVTCTAKQGRSFETGVCAEVERRLLGYKPSRLAANRTLTKTVVDIGVWSNDIGVVVLLLIKDPVGKNAVKLAFAPGSTVPAVADRAVVALDQVLQLAARPGGAENIVVFPNPLGGK